MARLVLVNGVPASGKSTLARRYADAHPLTLDLELDVVRAMLGGWLGSSAEAGLLARRMGLEMARVQLREGRDVLVPQYLGRLDLVLRLEQLCGEVGAELVEVVLLASPQDAARRFARRSRDPETPAHRDAAALQERHGGLAALPALHDRLLEVVARRPRTVVVRTVDGQVEQAYRDLVAALDGR